MPTKEKLKLLSKHKGLEEKYYDQIWKDKQFTTSLHFKNLNLDAELFYFFNHLIQPPDFFLLTVIHFLQHLIQCQ